MAVGLAAAVSVLALLGTAVSSASSVPSNAGAGIAGAALGSWQSLVRINAGASAFTDSRGLEWSGDEYAVGGEPHRVTAAISGTNDAQLFQSERWGMTGYDIPVANGSYVLKLYFAEINPSSGDRRMNVSSGRESLLNNFDVADKVGDFQADVETFDVSVTDGHLPLAFSATSNSASVAGIELLKANAISSYRLKPGASGYTDTRGLAWAGDKDVTGALGTPVTTTANISGTDDPALYQSQREGMDGYTLPVANATYVLKMYFAESDPDSGPRVFSVYNGDEALLTDFNIAAKVGDYRADVEQFIIKITDGQLALRFSAAQNQARIAGIELLTPTAESATSTANPPTDSPTQATAVPINTPSMAGWHEVASDSFPGSSIDTSKWGTYNGAGNEGVGTRSSSQLKVANGELDILGQGSVGGGAAFNYSSTYGRYVITARQDAGSGYGPALLLWPDSGKWPQDGEIDISEMPDGGRTQSYFTVHYGANNSQVAKSSGGDFTQWHTWTLEWTADHISLWLDGVLQSTVTSSPAIPHDPMHLAVQNDVGAAGHWIPARDSSTPSTVSLHIASVAAYQPN